MEEKHWTELKIQYDLNKNDINTSIMKFVELNNIINNTVKPLLILDAYFCDQFVNCICECFKCFSLILVWF